MTKLEPASGTREGQWRAAPGDVVIGVARLQVPRSGSMSLDGEKT